MTKLETFAERMQKILNRCDGGCSYPWAAAVADMNALLSDMHRFHPYKQSSRLVKRLLIGEAQRWLGYWTRYRVIGGFINDNQ